MHQRNEEEEENENDEEYLFPKDPHRIDRQTSCENKMDYLEESSISVMALFTNISMSDSISTLSTAETAKEYLTDVLLHARYFSDNLGRLLIHPFTASINEVAMSHF